MEHTPELQQFIISLFAEQGNREKQQKIERYRRLNKFVKPGQILFVGSSLMEQFPVQELAMDLELPYLIYNRGVGGFTTEELAEVLDVCVYDLQPRHIFINIGTNDLNGADVTIQDLISRYESILEKIKSHLPEATLHLMAYYPVNEPVGRNDPFLGEVFKHRSNARIQQANAAVRALAEKIGANYYDFNDGLREEDGNLKVAYTAEGMHFYADGYMTVLERMLPVLKKLV